MTETERKSTHRATGGVWERTLGGGARYLWWGSYLSTVLKAGMDLGGGLLVFFRNYPHNFPFPFRFSMSPASPRACGLDTLTPVAPFRKRYRMSQCIGVGTYAKVWQCMDMSTKLHPGLFFPPLRTNISHTVHRHELTWKQWRRSLTY